MTQLTLIRSFESTFPSARRGIVVTNQNQSCRESDIYDLYLLCDVSLQIWNKPKIK